MLALPCCRRGGNVDGDGDDAGGAPVIGLEEEAPPTAPPDALGGGRGCAYHVRYRPSGLRLRPPSNSRGESSLWLNAATQGR